MSPISKSPQLASVTISDLTIKLVAAKVHLPSIVAYLQIHFKSSVLYEKVGLAVNAKDRNL